jgi:S-(hydroxymethyl)glutathione dehydrogenase/alcohol dehydrogenase
MYRTTRAAIASGAGSFSIEEIEVGSPVGDEVLVEIRASGLCHTDRASLGWRRPLVMGHEGAGVVLETGPSVTAVKPGDRVVLNWAIPCGGCRQCRRGSAVLCEVSRPAHVMTPSAAHAHAEGTRWRGRPVDRSFNLGTLCGLALVRQAAVTRLETPVSFESAAIVGCGVMTGFGSAVNVAQIQPGDTVAVVGCGGVGLNVIQGARIAGAARIVALDLHREALERARRFGATDVIQAERDDMELEKAAIALHRILDGGADHAFEATSVPRLAFSPLRLVRDGGQAFQVSGINDAVTVPMPLFMWNKRYSTPLYGGCVPHRDLPRIFALHASGELLLDELVSRTYRLDDLGTAFEDMLAGRLAKGVIRFDA